MKANPSLFELAEVVQIAQWLFSIFPKEEILIDKTEVRSYVMMHKL
jgi:hypothetical protein